MTPQELSKLTKLELLELAKSNGLRVTGTMSKADLVDAITAAERRKKLIAASVERRVVAGRQSKAPRARAGAKKIPADKSVARAKAAAKKVIAAAASLVVGMGCRGFRIQVGKQDTERIEHLTNEMQLRLA